MNKFVSKSYSRHPELVSGSLEHRIDLRVAASLELPKLVRDDRLLIYY